MFYSKLIPSDCIHVWKNADVFGVEIQTECPRCKSDDIRTVDSSYPKAYECNKCKYNFVKGRQALIDE